MVQRSDISELLPPPGLEIFFRAKPARLWAYGNAAVLDGRLLGIISARQINADLVFQSQQLVKQLTALKEVTFVSGWHSLLEKQALELILDRGAALILCIAKALDQFKTSSAVERRLGEGKALLLTHCSPKAKRITRDASRRRNEMVAGLTKVLLVLSAPEGSGSLRLAKAALSGGKIVLAPEHLMNKELLSGGALPATLENVQESLRRIYGGAA